MSVCLMLGSKWHVKNLRYKITKYPADNDLSVSEVDEEIARAFDVSYTAFALFDRVII